MKRREGFKGPDHRSIFFRLLIVLLATMGLIHIVIGGAFGLLSGSGSLKTVQANMRHYSEILARDMGSPPDTVMAGQLAESYQIYIKYESGDMIWTSHPTSPHIERWKGLFGPGAMWRKPVVVENADGSRYTLIWRFGPFIGMMRPVLIGLVLIITLIFLGTHGYLRHILRPIHLLRKGVDEIKNGNLDVEIPIERQDELGRLTEAFNDMVHRIKEMLASRDQLLLDVSHELRSPLTRIRLVLEMMDDHEKKHAILADIRDIETMITEILETERLNTEHGKIHPKETDLVGLIRDTAESFNHGPGIDCANLPGSLNLKLDRERIRTVLKNVLDNAIKFSFPVSKPVQIKLATTAETVTVEILDDGIGIPKEQLPFIFEPFYRADRSRSKKTGGYGLGLHLCKKIMESHGGEIEIRNNTERGVTVTLRFCR
jgi:signal transduction histidine kinase